MTDNSAATAEVARRLAAHQVTPRCQYVCAEKYERGNLHKYTLTLTGPSGDTVELVYRVVQDGHNRIARGLMSPVLPGLLGLLDEAAMVLEAAWDERAWLTQMGVSLYVAPELTAPHRQQWQRIMPDARKLEAFLAPYGGLEDWTRWARGCISTAE